MIDFIIKIVGFSALAISAISVSLGNYGWAVWMFGMFLVMFFSHRI